MSQEFKTIIVLCGGASSEREVSLSSARNVFMAVEQLPYTCLLWDIKNTSGLVDRVRREPLPLIINMIHGGFGEDGTLTALLERANIVYTGSDAKSSALAMDKWQSKKLWRQNNLATPSAQLATEDAKANRAIVEQLGGDVVIKPINEGSSFGLSIVHSGLELEAGIDLARQYSATVMIEQYIAGKELTVGIVDDEVLPTIEIDTGDQLYDYFNKYDDNAITQYLFPEFDQELQRQIDRLALKSFQILGCSGLGRVDLMLDHLQRLYLIEVNTVPGMTGHSLVPKAAAKKGVNITQIYRQLIDRQQ